MSSPIPNALRRVVLVSAVLAVSLVASLLLGCDGLIPAGVRAVESVPFVGFDPTAKVHGKAPSSRPAELFDPYDRKIGSNPNEALPWLPQVDGEPGFPIQREPYLIVYKPGDKWLRLHVLWPQLTQFPLPIEFTC